VVRIGHEDTRRLLLRDGDPARPAPEVTFADSYTLEVGGERVELAWHGPNHTPDNIYIHFPDHDALMFIDVVNAGWVPIYNTNLSEDVIGYMGAPDIALSYPWTHLISGHVGRLATRDDVAVHQQYIADIEASSREALASVNPVPFYVDAGANVWLGIKGHLNAVTTAAAAPVIASTPACWPPRTSRNSPTRPRSPSCSRCASTRARADRFTPDRNAPGAGANPGPGAWNQRPFDMRA
jgi:glyoxylase-like metal-dependent hydrolase (beta-lactamase superfamily II)